MAQFAYESMVSYSRQQSRATNLLTLASRSLRLLQHAGSKAFWPSQPQCLNTKTNLNAAVGTRNLQNLTPERLVV